MKFAKNLKDLWKVKTGRDDSPLDGESPYWLFSLLFHIALLMGLALFFVEYDKFEPVAIELSPSVAEIVDMPTEVEVEYEDDEEEIGVNDAESESENAQEILMMDTQSESLVQEAIDIEMETRDFGEIAIENFEPNFDSEVDVQSVAVNGVAGYATNNTQGAIDRITHEILMSLEERPTLVVWMFDQSASLLKQRAEILSKFENVYDELGQLEEDGNKAFKDHDEIPLLTQVVAFGKNNGELLRKPTNDISRVMKAIEEIPVDESGVENVFEAVANVGRKYRSLCKVDKKTGEKKRNVMIVIVSDECGDDYQNLEAAIDICRKNLIRVYTVGIPAPFGREFTYVKWIDPDTNYDQAVQWAPVRQGAESIRPERIKLHFTDEMEEEELFDSGFGPFGLTRLSYQTGGVYFTVHPNRTKAGDKTPRWKTSTYSAHLSRFFDPEVMRRYRPDYVSLNQYDRMVKENKSREALVQAGYVSRVKPMTPPELRFPKFDEAAFSREVSIAQRAAAVLEPKMNELYQILKTGESDREYEASLRWKAGYDLAMGRVIAVKIRAESYNAMLAQAKTTLKFKDPKNNTWVLKPADVISTGSQSEKMGRKAREYLERVVSDHPNTPWAVMAQQELSTPIGWEWRETYTRPPQPPAPRPNNNANNTPRPQRPAMTPRPKRPPPKL